MKAVHPVLGMGALVLWLMAREMSDCAAEALGIAKDDVVELGQVLGYVASPTKYFGEDGTHLNFAMTKDKKPVDPKQFFK